MNSTTTLDTGTVDGPMAIVRAEPAGAPVGRVVIFQDAPGIRPSLHDFAAKLSDAGYDVAMPDLWHRHGRLVGYEPADVAADPSRRQHIMEMLSTFNDAEVRTDFEAALAAVGWLDESVAVIGFCMGARAVHRAMVERPDHVVAGSMWHPSFLADDGADSPHRSADALRQPLYIGIGDADQVQSIAMHQPYFDAVNPLEDVTIEVFAGADHGFTWPVSPNYHSEAATTSFTATDQMFRAAFAAHGAEQ